MLLNRIILMRKYVLLVVGNRCPLRFIWGRKYFTRRCWSIQVVRAINLLPAGLQQHFNHKLLVLIHWLCLLSRSDIGLLLSRHWSLLLFMSLFIITCHLFIGLTLNVSVQTRAAVSLSSCTLIITYRLFLSLSTYVFSSYLNWRSRLLFRQGLRFHCRHFFT